MAAARADEPPEAPLAWAAARPFPGTGASPRRAARPRRRRRGTAARRPSPWSRCRRPRRRAARRRATARRGRPPRRARPTRRCGPGSRRAATSARPTSAAVAPARPASAAVAPADVDPADVDAAGRDLGRAHDRRLDARHLHRGAPAPRGTFTSGMLGTPGTSGTRTSGNLDLAARPTSGTGTSGQLRGGGTRGACDQREGQDGGEEARRHMTMGSACVNASAHAKLAVNLSPRSWSGGSRERPGTVDGAPRESAVILTFRPLLYDGGPLVGFAAPARGPRAPTRRVTGIRASRGPSGRRPTGRRPSTGRPLKHSACPPADTLPCVGR